MDQGLAEVDGHIQPVYKELAGQYNRFAAYVASLC